MKHARDDYRFIVDLRSLSDEQLDELRTELANGDLGPGIPPEEPVFLLRAKDIAAPRVVAYWAEAAELAGADPKMVFMAQDHAVKMNDWQVKQGYKVPDLPNA